MHVKYSFLYHNATYQHIQYRLYILVFKTRSTHYRQIRIMVGLGEYSDVHEYNALNFLLYSLSGSRFREELKRVVCRITDAADTAFIALKPMAADATANDSPLNRNCSVQTPDINQCRALDRIAVRSQNTISSNTTLSLQIVSSSSPIGTNENNT